MASRKESAGIRCPMCGVGRLVRETRETVVAYKGHTAPVSLLGDWCPHCGDGILEGAALEKQERAFFKLRARVEGVLSPGEVAAIRKRLGLSQRQAGELLGGGPRAFQKYESGEQAVSTPMTNLLRLLAKDPRRLAELQVGA